MTSKIDKKAYTPMMQQYLTIKEQYQDTLVFFRLGDFYELFFDDALLASRVLEIALTGRDAGVKERVPMCGVPYHAAYGYIEKLINNGYKVAIVEQVEDPKESKGIVKRDVVRMITPGTVMDHDFLDEKVNNYIASVSDFVTNYVISYADLSTGELFCVILDKDDKLLINELLSIETKEVVVSHAFNSQILHPIVNTNHVTISYEDEVSAHPDYLYTHVNITDSRLKMTINRLLHYLLNTQKRSLSHLQVAKVLNSNQYLMIDVYSKRNLEIFETIRTGSKKGSLLWLIDKAETAMGSRMIKQWLDKPLVNMTDINHRYDVVSSFQEEFIMTEELKNSLKNVYDLERLVGRIAYDNANAKDLLQLKRSLKEMPFIKAKIDYLNKTYQININSQFETFDDLYELLDNSIHEDAPYTIKDGGVIKDHFNEELDHYRDASRNGKQYIAELVKREKERTGIKSLKVGYNKVFGYYIEITKSNLSLLPTDSGYERKQTLANAERFITQELKELESMILNAEEKSIKLEYELFINIRNQIKAYSASLQRLAKAIAEIDALISFAMISQENRFVRPTLVSEHIVEIKNGRHPVVEKLLTDTVYVENDILMDDKTNILLITGPNMSGKSTYMRQMALITILAQVGCFVPCDSCKMKVFDKIFTRIGATDDLISGQSTFMIEMIEANNALHNATSDSLILFDEIGRGTATFDGMALAQGITEYIHEKIKAKTLFSTHYHELTALENNLKNLTNVHVRAEENNQTLTFLHKVELGLSDKSYGIQVAKLADLPSSLINRAEKILKKLEQNKKEVVIDADYNLFDFDFNKEKNQTLNEEEQEVLRIVEETNFFDLTPMDALNLLYKLQTKIKGK
ncbi:DNA mismatch repair protein MutS [Mycoplasmatota bacterium]|nr:DNA mismatch repair protein MutS [Mycoplasmatota bacterium]